MATNQYGLDVHYMRKKLESMVRDIDCYTPDEAFRELSRIASTTRHQSPDMVSVPREPTEAMIMAGIDELHMEPKDIWEAMLAAAEEVEG